MKVLYFDLVAIILVSILLFSLVYRKLLIGRTNRLFAVLLVHLLVSTIADIWAEAYGVWIPITQSNHWIQEALCYIYFPLRNLTTPLYHLFLYAITDTWHTKSFAKKLTLFIPYGLDCVVLLLNPINHLVFYYDENWVYHRGPMMYLLYIVALYYLVAGVAYLIRYRKMVSADKFVPLMLMYPLNLLAVGVQFVWPQVLAEAFTTSITMLLVALVIQRPEEIINPVLGVRSYIAFTTDAKKAAAIEKPVQVIYAKITNFQAISLLLEYDKRMQMLKELALELIFTCKAINLPLDLYYLEDGLFAIVTEKDDPPKIKEAAQRISAQMNQSKQRRVELEACVCIVREALIKSASVSSERFCPQTRNGR